MPDQPNSEAHWVGGRSHFRGDLFKWTAGSASELDRFLRVHGFKTEPLVQCVFQHVFPFPVAFPLSFHGFLLVPSGGMVKRCRKRGAWMFRCGSL